MMLLDMHPRVCARMSAYDTRVKIELDMLLAQPDV